MTRLTEFGNTILYSDGLKCQYLVPMNLESFPIYTGSLKTNVRALNIDTSWMSIRLFDL